MYLTSMLSPVIALVNDKTKLAGKSPTAHAVPVELPLFGQLHELFNLRVKFDESPFLMESCSVTCQLACAKI